MSTRLSLTESVISGYELLERIGGGGSATVYRCKQASAGGQAFAAKVFHQPINDPLGLRRFERECEAQGKLAGCPGVVALIDQGVKPDGNAWIVTELCEVSYAERLLTLGAIPADEVIDLGYQLATTLAHAHALNIIHGDIKPGNIYLSNEGYALLGDFGASVDLDQTVTAQCDLSFAYVAPETLKRGVVSVQTDLYSLGATLYHLVSGQSPLPTGLETSARMPLGELLQHLDEVKPQTLSLPPAYQGLAELIEQQLSKQPSERAGSASQLARQFKSMQMGVPVLQSPVDRVTTYQTDHTRANRGWLPRAGFGFIAGVLATLMLASIILLWSGERSLSPTADRLSSPTNLSGSLWNCDSTAYLCEAFDGDLDAWESSEDTGTASLALTNDAWSGQALAWTPTDKHQDGSSFLYRVIPRPVAGEGVRIRLRLKLTSLTPDYFWMTGLQFNSNEGHTWSLNLQRIQQNRIAFDLLFYNAGEPGNEALPTEVPFPVDQWLCVELLIDPASESILQLFVDGQYTGQMRRAPIALEASSYEIVVGSTDAQSPATAPVAHYDELVIERGTTSVCRDITEPS